MLSTLCILAHLIFATALSGKNFYHHSLIDKAEELAKGHSVTGEVILPPQVI